MSSMKASQSKFLNCLDSIIFWISFQRIMFMSSIDKTVVRNANMQDPMVRYDIWFALIHSTLVVSLKYIFFLQQRIFFPLHPNLGFPRNEVNQSVMDGILDNIHDCIYLVNRWQAFLLKPGSNS